MSGKRPLTAGAALALTIILADAHVASADSLALSGTFQTFNQSMWGSGGDTFAFHYGQSFNLPWNASKTVGSIDCGPFGLVCSGAVMHASTSGNFGMGVELGVNSGTVSAAIPVDLGLTYASSVPSNQGVVVTSSALFGAGDLVTQSPSVYGVLSMDLELAAAVNGTGCLEVGPIGGCDTFSKNFNVELHPDLLSFNKNNDGQLRILGITRPFTFDTTYIDVTVNLPSIGTASNGPLPLSATGQAQFIDLQGNAVNIATTALGYPPLSGSVAGVLDYNLLSAGLALDVDVTQKVKLFNQSVTVRLDVAETGQSFQFVAGQNSPVINFLGHDKLTITPTFTVQASFANDIGLDLTPYLFANGGAFGLFGLDVGPLFNKTLPLGDIPLGVYDDDFLLGGFSPIVGNAFTIVATEADTSVPEPVTVSLLGSGIAVAFWRRRRTAR